MEVNPQFENLRVMIVDDDAMTLRVMSHLLGALGVKDPLTAGDGQQALEYIDGSARPDVIFSDLNMPGLDGVEFFRHLSERGVAASIVLISGEDKRILETAKTLGAAHDLQVVGTLQKPIIIDDLDRLLSQCLEAGSKAASGAISPVTEAELMEGLKDPPDGAVQVVFQPKVEVATGAVLGVEALARWNHPTRGLLEPDSFIPLTETLGQATRLTEIVTRYVTAEAGRWGENGSQLQLAINTSVSALHRLDLPEFIVSSANEAGIDPSRITVELTESQLMQEFKKSMEILTRLRLKGVKLSIDDFGTGFSSMEQLRRIPFNELDTGDARSKRRSRQEARARRGGGRRRIPRGSRPGREPGLRHRPGVLPGPPDGCTSPAAVDSRLARRDPAGRLNPITAAAVADTSEIPPRPATRGDHFAPCVGTTRQPRAPLKSHTTLN
jgi:EAL domain-containing protein (putative c-di-GMP-specific phosphodiesterase class I)